MWSPSRSAGNPPQSAPETTGAPTSANALPAANRPYKDGSTYIGKSLIIKGEVSGSEPIHIEGRIEGPISLRDCHVNIGRDGVVMSNVEAGEVIVRGTMRGDLTALDRVEVHSGGSLTGDVSAGRVTIELGAHFQGRVDMRRPDPKAHIDLEKKSNKKTTQTEQSETESSMVLAH